MLRNDLPHVRARGRLKRANVAPAGIHAVVADMTSAVKVFADNNAVAAADGLLRLESGMADSEDPLVDIQIISNHDFLAWGFGRRNFLRRNGVCDRMRQLARSFLRTAPAEEFFENIHLREQI